MLHFVTPLIVTAFMGWKLEYTPMQMNGIKLVRYLSVALAVAISAGASAQQAPPLTKAQAVAVALEKNPFRKMALADERAANAGIDMAQSSLFPRVTFSETATGGNDAVYAFGTRLRQARFTQADFAPDRLNYPARSATSPASSAVSGTSSIPSRPRARSAVRGTCTLLRSRRFPAPARK
jgi:hypothetical protein